MVALPLLLDVGRQVHELVTEDVSHGGLFLRTELELGLRQLVRVSMLLPPHADHFEAAGKIVHQLPHVQGDRGGGIGIQFYGLGSDARARWATFIASVREFPEANERSASLASAAPVTPLFVRGKSCAFWLKIHVATLTDLITLFRRDITRKRMFVLTERPCFVGDLVGLWVVHPHTDDVFELAGRVARCVRDHGVGGIDLALLDIDHERMLRFEEFVYDAIAPYFDDEEVHRA